ncbi:MAG: hypothetical protein ACLRXQ_00545 [Phascolarctobacterium faecium]
MPMTVGLSLSLMADTCIGQGQKPNEAIASNMRKTSGIQLPNWRDAKTVGFDGDYFNYNDFNTLQELLCGKELKVIDPKYIRININASWN